MSATASKKSRGPTKNRPGGRPHLTRNAAILTVAAVLVLFGIYLVSRPDDTTAKGSGKAGAYAFQVGDPGTGKPAPSVKLTATDGSTFDLAAHQGKNTLLYFQEGVGCQPCWDQIVDIQKHRSQFHALGIDDIVTITGDPTSALRQKAADGGITIPVLSDPDLAVSRTYDANHYGMMGDSTDGHTFVLVGPDGQIRWRADYGGAPDYTMYVPVSNLVADMRKGIGAHA